MKKLYAKIVLLLIRPALEADRKERTEEALINLGPSPERTKVLNRLLADLFRVVDKLDPEARRNVRGAVWQVLLNGAPMLWDRQQPEVGAKSSNEIQSEGEQKSHSPSEGGRVRSAEDEAILAEALEEYRTRAQGNAEEHLKDLVIALRRPFRRQTGLADLQPPQSLCEKHRDQERPAHQEYAQERQTPPAAPVRDQ